MDTRYTLFRNFMANELGITRDDIKAWTVAAVAVETKRLMGQINIADIVAKNSVLSFTDKENVKRLIADQVAKAIVVTLTPKPPAE